ncbi:MAG: carbohydrate ABC transporter permease [Clostridia bacterium]|nr:carbohydrate ABC transporter permease [Clostridia bacterium]
MENNSNSSLKVMKEKDIRKVASTQKVAKVFGQILVYTFLGIMALIVLFPFYFMIISSLKSLEEYRLAVPTLIPQSWKFQNYTDILIPFEMAEANGWVGTLVSPEAATNDFDLFTLFRNTMFVGIVSTILSLVITVLSAFAFARLNFKGKNALFAALLGTMMIPGELFTITNYATVMTKGGWFPTFFNGLGNMFGLFGPDFRIPFVDSSFAALIVPFLVSVFYIYLLRQNFLQIPNELYLAAKVDGTSDIKYLCKVMIPLALPTIISITILKMMGAWNSYMWPRLVANDDAHRLITNGLRNAFNDVSGNTDYPRQMAAVALVSLPLFLVFIFFRKYIMKGVSRSGIKG